MPMIPHPNDTFVRLDYHTLRVTRTSPLTGKQSTQDLPITDDEWKRFNSGALAQHSLVRLTRAQAEFVLSGSTETDWATMFPPEDDEEAEA